MVYAFFCLCACAPVESEQFEKTSCYDLAIINGRVIDPEANLDTIRNIGLLGNKIAAVTKREIESRQIIDAVGKIVAPGFIDFHAHGQTVFYLDAFKHWMA